MISIENLSKVYRMGTIGSGSLRDDFVIWWANIRGKENPLLKIGESTERIEGEYFWALRDINLKVKEGEVLGIIGENGAGKSTLLKILSRITSPTEGEFHLGGRLSSLIEVGTGFHGELTGRENIYLNGAIHGMARSEIDRRLDEIVDFAGVGEYIDTPVKRYSSGMYVRLGFAVAAHLNSEILLVDEVLAVGDIEFQNKALGKMKDVALEGRTILFVSHNMDAIRRLCTRVILFEDGIVKENGSVDDIITKYFLQNSPIELTSQIELPKSILPDIMRINNRENKNQLSVCGNHLSFFNNDSKPQYIFKIGETWKIRIDFEVHNPLEHCIVAVGLVTIKHVAIVTFWSKPKKLTPGKYFAQFDVDIPLKACDIQFAVGISNYERSIYYAEGIGRVSIMEISKETSQPFRAKGSGILLSEQITEIKSIR